ncbi:plasmid recombination protein [Falsiroseomonas sp.]|uniref:plasmid recombination protein n=1 Tax=Falsiroseomonas sp. TaxID=2870721 RepID=UPI003F71437C
MPKMFASFHFGKIRSRQALTARWRHNSRQENELLGRDVPQIVRPNVANRHLGPDELARVARIGDVEAGAHMPFDLGEGIAPADRGEPMSAWRGVIERAGANPDPEAVRANAVIACEFVFVASPAWFNPTGQAEDGDGDPERLRLFSERTARWFVTEFGHHRMLRFDLHADERSVHGHGLMVPLTAEPTAGGRHLGMRLGARVLFGGFEPGARSPMSDLQDSYADAMAPLGLVRGVVGSGAEHCDFRMFKAKEAAEVVKSTMTGWRASVDMVAAQTAREAEAAEVAARAAESARLAAEARARARARAAKEEAAHRANHRAPESSRAPAPINRGRDR